MAVHLDARWHTLSTSSPVRAQVATRILHDPRIASLGTIVFCHGLGMGAESYDALQRHWAQRGYAVVAPEFSDSLAHLARTLPHESIDRSDPTAWMTNERVVEHALGLMFDTDQWIGRALDASAVIDGLDELLGTVPGASPDRPIVAGHSYGGHTAQLIGGARIDRGNGLESFAHESVSAAIPMSPQGSGERGLTRDSWAAIDIPWLVISGEHDIAARGQGLEWRREAFDLAPAGGRHLAVVRAADHGLGGIAGPAPIYRGDAEAVLAVTRATTAFIDAARSGAAVATDSWWPADERLATESK